MLLLLAGTLAAAAASPNLPILSVTVINCTSPDDPDFLMPFAAHVDPRTGATVHRVVLPATGPDNVTSIDTNFAPLDHQTAFVGTSDQPPGYPEGIRTLLATVSNGSVVKKRRVVPSNVTDAASWNPLSASWYRNIGPSLLMARHRSLDFSPSGGGPMLVNEWVEVINSTQQSDVWRSTIVYNSTTEFAHGTAMPSAYFGDIFALDRTRGLLFSQGCPRADPFNDNRTLVCTHASDVVVWDVHSSQQLRRLPMHNTTLHSLYFDPATETLGGLVYSGRASSTRGRFHHVHIDTASGELTQDGAVLLPSSLALASGTFSNASGLLALLMIAETGTADWSRGDPSALVTLSIPVRSVWEVNALAVYEPVPQPIRVTDVVPKCVGRDVRYSRPSLDYLF